MKQLCLLVLALVFCAIPASASDQAWCGYWQIDGWIRNPPFSMQSYEYYISDFYVELGSTYQDTVYEGWSDADWAMLNDALDMLGNTGSPESGSTDFDLVLYWEMVPDGFTSYTENNFPDGELVTMYAHSEVDGYDLLTALYTGPVEDTHQFVFMDWTFKDANNQATIGGQVGDSHTDGAYHYLDLYANRVENLPADMAAGK
jgi:hypothetical protein